jgi:hypothetical protein
MRARALTRCLVWMSAAGWPLVVGLPGCAQGESYEGVLGLPDGDAGAPGEATDGDPDATSDAGGNEASDATTSTDGTIAPNDAETSSDGRIGHDAQIADDAFFASDASDASNLPDSLSTSSDDASGGGDAPSSSDAGFDASVTDAGAPQDAGLDAPADVVDSGPPVSCTSTCGAQALCITGFCVASRRVFVSTESFTGNLGGTSGADHSCQSLANGAGLGGTWKAWVSDDSTSPSTRFTQATVGYRLLDGTLLAANWSVLVGGALLHTISLTEQRTSATNAAVWTGTLSTGVAIGSNVCSGFTSSANGAAAAVIGNTGRTDIGWSNATSEQCDSNNLRIYCMEQ